MNPVLQEILDSGTVNATDGSEPIRLHSYVSPEEGEFLQSMIASIRPAVGLEVGLAFGISSLFICESMKAARPDARHIVIDPSQNDPSEPWNGIGLKNLERAGFRAMVEFHEKPSQVVLPELETRGTQLDFAFVDGWHTFDHTLVDFFYIDRMLKVGGIMIFDDTDVPPVHKVCRFVATNRAYRVVGSTGEMPYDKFSVKRRFIQAITRRSSRIRELFRPEIRQTDRELGLVGSCIAFRKEANDDRTWDFDRDF